MILLTALVSFTLAQADAGERPGSGSAPPIAGKPTEASIASLVVTRAAQVKPGELVLVTGGQQDRALLEQLALQVQKAGAHAVLQVESESLERAGLLEVPASADPTIAAGAAKLWSSLDTVITVPHVEHLDYLGGVPAARRASRAAAQLKLEQLANQRGVKRIELGNGIYPTDDNARRLGMSRADLSAAFFSAVAVEPAELAARAARVAKLLRSGRTLRLTHPNGSNLEVKLAGRAPRSSDGVLSPEAIKQGGSATLLWLPAGEVYVAPAPGTAEGTLVIDRAFYAGTEITGLRLTFKAGRLTALSAKKGGETLRELYELEPDPRKGDFAFIDVGLNPRLDANRVLTFNAAGMVTVGFGNNLWAGGDNSVPFDVGGCYLPGATLTVDGEAVVKVGKLLGN